MSRTPIVLRLLGGLLLLSAARETRAQGGWPVGAGATRTTPRDRPVDDAVTRARRTGADGVDALAVLLAQRDSIGLTAAQTTRVARIRARRDSVVRPLWAAVDSLAVTADADAWQRLTDAQRAILREQLQLRSRTLLAVREAEQTALAAAYDELTGTQRADIERRTAAARRAADDSLRNTRAGGWAGFRGQRP